MLFRKVFYHTAFLFVARLIFRALNAGTVILIARFLGADRYGYFESALAVVNILLVFNDLGMSTLLVREASRQKDKLPVYFGNTLVVESLLSVVLYGLMILVAWLLYHNPVITSLVSLLGAANLIFEHRKVFRGTLRVVFKMASLGWIEILNGLANFGILLLITRLTDPLTGLFRIAQAQLLINLLIVSLFGMYAMLIVNIRPKLHTQEIVPMLKQAYLFSLTQLFTVLYFSIDQILISKLRPIEEVGWYSAPFKIIIFLIIVPQMIFQVIQPLMFRLATEDLERYKRIHFTLLRYLSAFGLPIGAVCIIFAEPLIQVLFGEQFSQSALPLRWFGAFIMVYFIASAAEYSLTSLDQQRSKLLFQLVAVALNVVLDVFLILQFGFFGASIATFIAECLLAGSFVWKDLRTLQEKFSQVWLQIWKPLIATGLTVILAVFVFKPHLSLGLSLILSSIIYLSGLWMFKFLRPYDLKLLHQLLPVQRNSNKPDQVEDNLIK